MLDSQALRATMVASQLRTNDVTDARLTAAVMAVPRERFAPMANPALAYREGCIDVGHGRALLDPRTFGKLVQLAGIAGTDTVLDVGCATGYSTAVLAKLAKSVVGLEEDESLAVAAAGTLRELGVANARVMKGRLAAGAPDEGPFDAIFVNGAVEVRPETLLAQLADNGRLVTVVFERGAGHGAIFVRHNGAIGERFAFDAQVPVLPGFAKAPSFVF